VKEDVSSLPLDAERGIRRALEKSEERFRRAVEFSPTAMVMVDAEGTIEMVNAQTERMFGYDRSNLLGRPVEMLVPERSRRTYPSLRQSFFRNPRSRPMGAGRELYGLRKDGSEFPVEIGLNPIETDEGLMVLAAIMDVSDRKQTEASLQAALAEKDVLLGEIHHRVKNNLQIVCSLLDLQSGRIGDARVAEMLRDSQNRVKSMALIHQTLYQSNDFAQIDFASFLHMLCTSLMSSYGLEPDRIDLRIEANGPSLPLNAAIPCGLVVNELITNALKHGFPDGRRGTIGIGFEGAGEGRARLTVSDDGVGISEGVDFKTAGTLGLQLVHILSEQIRGELDIRRAAPTRFSLTFPIQDEEQL
jgi:PAS domain S-box-containing protein